MNLVHRLGALGLVASSFLAACGDDPAASATDQTGSGGSGGRAGGGPSSEGASGKAGSAGKGGSAGTGGTVGVGGTAGSGGDVTGQGVSGAAGSTSGNSDAGAAGTGIAGQTQGGAGTSNGSAGTNDGGAGGPVGGSGSGGSAGSGNGGSNAGGANLGGTSAGGAGAGTSGGTGGGAGSNATGGNPAGGAGGGSGGSGPIPKGLGACGPATPLAIGAVVTDKLGSGSLAIDLSCGIKAEASSALYEITSAKSGALDIQFKPASVSPSSISARVTLEAGCASPTGETLLCPTDIYEKSLLTVPVQAGVPVTMALTRSPKADPAANFEFSVGFHEVVCGDGKVDVKEQCDPPNGTDCSAICQRQTPPCGDEIVTYPELCDPPGANGCGAACVYDQCPDLRILKDGGSVVGSFVGKTNVLRAACAVTSKSRQLTYTITAENTGVLELDVISDGYTDVSFVDSCASKASLLGCDFVKGTGRLTKAVKQGDEIVVVLTRDGGDPNQLVTLKAKTRAIVCGDSLVDPSEACDPPDGLTCSPSCQRQAPPCGDNIVTAPEQCDPPSGTLCDAQCRYLGCPNIVTLADGGTTTIDLANKPTFSESCNGRGNQVAIAVVPDNTGTLALTLEGDVGNYVTVAAETTCGEAASNIACREAKIAGFATTVSFPATKGQTLYLVIGGEKLASGPLPVKVTAQSKP